MLRSILVVAALVIASELLRAEVTKVDVATLEQLREAGVPVIDIRTPEEWNHTGVIDGSHLLTFADAGGRYDIDEWASRLAAIVAPRNPSPSPAEAEGGAASQAASWTDSSPTSGNSLYVGLPLSGTIKEAIGGGIDLTNFTRGVIAIAIGYSA